ncbi:phytanoyl-CoA dioxygenase family protein [Sphingobium subterraneum]|uniref:Ectoine hydroxylase-related dioxygenase (Phytanoyl-CoA dioxygenase family) n=1 Tax=Sphingobium subterraneum TaxID=627688 RepID=A0A841J2G8_9SPHN|nr:phytanoyl-CoA dioxygenase family protein [Sphingobium subterraneum]MBB6122825.1 ectoine hydroxylase-related dioxygenase (phytanoyl-CoA dioxygenase family) [Sphingobium subterraneum]
MRSAFLRSEDNAPIKTPGAQATEALLRDGYCIIKDIMPPENVAELAADFAPHFETTARSIGPFYGSGTKRFHRLLARSPRMAEFVLHPLVLDILDVVLGPNCDSIQLNLTQAIEILPGSEAQPPHRDQDMWTIKAPDVEYLVNVMWPFAPYTGDNGATILWPGSHRRQDEILIDPAEAIIAEMEPGAALLFLGSTLHCGGANISSASRRGMIISYALGWLKPYELPWLAYPPALARTFPPELAALAGYRAHRPNLGTFEGRCPSSLLGDEPNLQSGAIDTLRPEQEALIAAYRNGDIAPGPQGSIPSVPGIADHSLYRNDG